MDTFGHGRQIAILGLTCTAALVSIHISSDPLRMNGSELSIAPNVDETIILLEQDNASIPALENRQDDWDTEYDDADCRSIQCLIFAPEPGASHHTPANSRS